MTFFIIFFTWVVKFTFSIKKPNCVPRLLMSNELTFGLLEVLRPNMQLDYPAMYRMVHGLGSILCVLGFPQVCHLIKDNSPYNKDSIYRRKCQPDGQNFRRRLRFPITSMSCACYGNKSCQKSAFRKTVT